MSQKSSVPQAVSFVSQVLKRDSHRPYRQIAQREASDAWSQWTWLDEDDCDAGA